MSTRKSESSSSKLIANFYLDINGNWTWEVSNSGTRLSRYFSSGFSSLSDAIDDFISLTDSCHR